MSTAARPLLQPTDRELLMRFGAQGDQQAFRLLVQRHSRLVRSVCRRVLWDEQDIEDAYQATFLVLARSAASIRSGASVAGWLLRVAHRTASRAALRRVRRKEQPLSSEPEHPSNALEKLQSRELFEILMAELDRLPERYRLPLILLYLEGQSHRAAAEELDCTEAALKGRLARGRRLLRGRLARRGVALSVAVGTWAGWSAEAATAETILERTVSAAVEYLTTGQAGAACSPGSLSLAEGILRMKLFGFTKSTLALTLLGVAGLLTVAGLGIHRIAAGSDSPSPGAAEVPRVSAELDHLPPAAEEPPAVRLVDAGADAAKLTPPTAAPAPMPEPKTIDLKPRSEIEQKIETALKDPVDIRFVDIPLQEAMDFLADAHKVTIWIDQPALNQERIQTDEPLNIALSGVSLNSVLNLILEPLGLTYIIEDEVLKITTQTAAEGREVTRVYPIENLLEARFPPEAIQRTIEQVHAAATVEVLGDFLVVTQSQPAHRRTAELMEQLRSAAELVGSQPSRRPVPPPERPVVDPVDIP